MFRIYYMDVLNLHHVYVLGIIEINLHAKIFNNFEFSYLLLLSILIKILIF